MEDNIKYRDEPNVKKVGEEGYNHVASGQGDPARVKLQNSRRMRRERDHEMNGESHESEERRRKTLPIKNRRYLTVY